MAMPSLLSQFVPSASSRSRADLNRSTREGAASWWKVGPGGGGGVVKRGDGMPWDGLGDCGRLAFTQASPAATSADDTGEEGAAASACREVTGSGAEGFI